MKSLKHIDNKLEFSLTQQTTQNQPIWDRGNEEEIGFHCYSAPKQQIFKLGAIIYKGIQIPSWLI